MPHSSRAPVGLVQPDGWSLLADSQASASLAADPLAVPGFFAGWIAVGVVVALRLAARGHDRRVLVALGAGLGPLLLVLASGIRRRDAEATTLVLEPGIDRGGDLDVLVLVQDRPEHVRSVVPTLLAVRSDLATLTIARAVDYEWLDGDLDDDVVAAASASLLEAASLLPIEGAGLALHAGAPPAVADRFTAQAGRTLVLVAIEEPLPRPPAAGAG